MNSMHKPTQASIARHQLSRSGYRAVQAFLTLLLFGAAHSTLAGTVTKPQEFWDRLGFAGVVYGAKTFEALEETAGILNPHHPIAQIGRFIKATGCESAAVYQLRQNFLRAATSAKSLQKAYCLCFENQAKSIMTNAEYAHFADDFSRYFLQVQRAIEVDSPAPRRGDRRWQLYEVKRSCAR